MPTFDHGYALLVGVGADLPATVKDALRVGSLLGDPCAAAIVPKT